MNASAHPIRHHSTAWRLAAAFVLMLPASAFAAGFSVSPTRLEFADTDSVQGLHLHNTGDRTVNTQLRVFSWTQADGEDVLEPSTDLVVSPPMAVIQPGQRQFVRVVRKSAPAATQERSYRLLIDELPPARIDTAAAPSGLNFVLRYSVPVFVEAAADDAATVTAEWSLWTDTTGTPRLATHNAGTHRAQIADLRVVDAGGRTLLARDGLIGYVLAGATRQWPLKLSAQTYADAIAIEARINGEIHRQTLSARPLETPAR